MRFILDEILPPRMAELARDEGVDAISSHENGRNGLRDVEQLRWAAAEGRCLVTRDQRDFLELTSQFLARGAPHAGVLLVTRSLLNQDPHLLARVLVAYAEKHPDGMRAYTVDVLTREILDLEG